MRRLGMRDSAEVVWSATAWKESPTKREASNGKGEFPRGHLGKQGLGGQVPGSRPAVPAERPVTADRVRVLTPSIGSGRAGVEWECLALRVGQTFLSVESAARRASSPIVDLSH